MMNGAPYPAVPSSAPYGSFNVFFKLSVKQNDHSTAHTTSVYHRPKLGRQNLPASHQASIHQNLPQQQVWLSLDRKPGDVCVMAKPIAVLPSLGLLLLT